MTHRFASGKSDLPPLRVHHLLYFLAVAAMAAAAHRGIETREREPALLRELAEMTYWLAAALGLSLWALGAAWCLRGWRFLRQPGPWLVAASLADTGFPLRMATACEALALHGAGPLTAAVRDHWYAKPWSLAPVAIVGALALLVAALPSRMTAFGPLWRALLALVGAQLLAYTCAGPWVTNQGRWQGWRLTTWAARSRGSAAMALAATVHDATVRRRRHWSHALSVALWIAMQLGRNLALGE